MSCFKIVVVAALLLAGMVALRVALLDDRYEYAGLGWQSKCAAAEVEFLNSWGQLTGLQKVQSPPVLPIPRCIRRAAQAGGVSHASFLEALQISYPNVYAQAWSWSG